MLVVGDVHYYVIRTNDPNCNPLKKPVVPLYATLPAMLKEGKAEESDNNNNSNNKLAINKSTSVADCTTATTTNTSSTLAAMSATLKRLDLSAPQQSSVLSLSAPSSANGGAGRAFFSGSTSTVAQGSDEESTATVVARASHHHHRRHHHRHQRRPSLVAEEVYTRTAAGSSSSYMSSLATVMPAWTKESSREELPEACLLCSSRDTWFSSATPTMATTTMTTTTGTMAVNNKNNNTATLTLSDWKEMKRALDAAKEPLTFTAHYYATDDDYLMRRFVREYFKSNALNAEEIFLFTLYGSSQQNGDASFSTPLVSDPTNPNARADTLEDAVANHQASGNGANNFNSSSTSLSISSRRGSAQNAYGSRHHQHQHQRHRQRSSISSAFQRIRSLFDRPPTPSAEPSSVNGVADNVVASPTATATSASPNNSGTESPLLTSIRQVFQPRPQFLERLGLVGGASSLWRQVSSPSSWSSSSSPPLSSSSDNNNRPDTPDY